MSKKDSIESLNKKLDYKFVSLLYELFRDNKIGELRQKFEDFKNKNNDLKIDFTREDSTNDSLLKEISKIIELRKINNTNLREILLELAEPATWLDDHYKIDIVNYMIQIIHGDFKNTNFKFNFKEVKSLDIYLKLFFLLLSLPYAEYVQDKQGTFINFLYEYVIDFKTRLLKESIPSSYTPWQVPYPQLKKV